MKWVFALQFLAVILYGIIISLVMYIYSEYKKELFWLMVVATSCLLPI